MDYSWQAAKTVLVLIDVVLSKIDIPISESIKNPSTLINYFKNRGDRMDKSKRSSLTFEFDSKKGYNKNSFGNLLLTEAALIQWPTARLRTLRSATSTAGTTLLPRTT